MVELVYWHSSVRDGGTTGTFVVSGSPVPTGKLDL